MKALFQFWCFQWTSSNLWHFPLHSFEDSKEATKEQHKSWWFGLRQFADITVTRKTIELSLIHNVRWLHLLCFIPAFHYAERHQRKLSHSLLNSNVIQRSIVLPVFQEMFSLSENIMYSNKHLKLAVKYFDCDEMGSKIFQHARFIITLLGSLTFPHDRFKLETKRTNFPRKVKIDAMYYVNQSSKVSVKISN